MSLTFQTNTLELDAWAWDRLLWPQRPKPIDPFRTHKGVKIEKGTTAFILPCHNEAADLPAALESIKHQVNAKVDTILVVSDNSTDDTVAIAQAAGVLVIETVGNKFKKAGAFNAGLRYLMELRGALPEYIITGDGDTEYDQHFVSRAVKVMENIPRLGVLSAVCYGKPSLLPFPRWPSQPPTPRHATSQRLSITDRFLSLFIALSLMGQWLKSFVNYALVWMQCAEYSRAAMLRLRYNIHTMSGAGSMIRADAAIDALAAAALPADTIDWGTATLYREHAQNLVEDFALTLDIKKQGWLCTNNYRVVAQTDLMRDPASLFRQRVRWVRGTIDELRRRKFSRESRASSLTIIYGLMMIPFFYVINSLVLSVFLGGNVTLTNLWLFVLMGAYQAFMVKRMGWKSALVAFVLIPEMLYAVMRHTWIITSVIKSIHARSQNWE